MASECKAGVISFNCEFLTKDLVDPDKWHHTKLYLNNNGKVDMDIDGKAYFQDSVESDTFSGQETTSYSLTSADGERGEVRVVRTNSSASLNFDAYHLGGKRYVMGGAKLM